MVVHDDRLFVTASAGLAGDAVILEVKEAWSGAPAFAQVSPAPMRVFEIETFDGHLYAGTGDVTNGYSVWKTEARGDACASPPSSWAERGARGDHSGRCHACL
ncbi:MAG: hypothetical protein H0W55_09270 [Actinobacteria bacterium]|nr:hypothetical protein [Actinomycetota bacterium]